MGLTKGMLVIHNPVIRPYLPLMMMLMMMMMMMMMMVLVAGGVSAK